MPIDPEMIPIYKARSERIFNFCKSFYIEDSVIDGNKAVAKIREIEILESMVDSETGASYYYGLWKEANEEKKEIANSFGLV